MDKAQPDNDLEKRIQRTLELDRLGSKEPWLWTDEDRQPTAEPSDTVHILSIDGSEIVTDIRFFPSAEDLSLIVEYRTLAPMLARELLRLRSSALPKIAGWVCPYCGPGVEATFAELCAECKNPLWLGGGPGSPPWFGREIKTLAANLEAARTERDREHHHHMLEFKARRDLEAAQEEREQRAARAWRERNEAIAAHDAERARAEKAEQSLKISEEVEVHATAQRNQTLNLLEERIARLTERAEKAERGRDAMAGAYSALKHEIELRPGTVGAQLVDALVAKCAAQKALLDKAEVLAGELNSARARLADLERWREQAGPAIEAVRRLQRAKGGRDLRDVLDDVEALSLPDAPVVTK